MEIVHKVFIDLEKAHDKKPWGFIWLVLDKRSVSKGYIDIIKDVYEGVVTNVRTTCGEACEFLLAIGLH